MAWADAEPYLRERAYRMIDNDPQVLLAGDAAPPVGVEADAFFARLIGFDEQVTADIRIAEPLREVLTPLPQRLSLTVGDPAEWEPPRVGRYVCQSGWSLMTVSGEDAPPNVTLGSDFMVRLLFLRYRRRQ